MELNGHGDPAGGNYLEVYVSDSLDQVEVHYVVTGGPDTTVTITKDYMDKLRYEHPDLAPALLFWGRFFLYDVDAGWVFGIDNTNGSGYQMVRQHLRERGFLHDSPGSVRFITGDSMIRLDKPYGRIVMS